MLSDDELTDSFEMREDESGSSKSSIIKKSESGSQYDSEYDSEESCDDSDCDSSHSLYQLIENRKAFAPLKVMLLMEYADMKTLRELIDSSGSGGLERKTIFHLFKQLMSALKHIHSNGLIHRDIKPENIFVNPTTHRLQVGDLGLAKTVNKIETDQS